MERMPIYIDKIKFLEAILDDLAITRIKWSKEEQQYIREKIEELKKQKEVRKDGRIS